MGFFRRRPKPDADSSRAQGTDASAPRTVHERIEVTVEREWVSMVVKNPAVASTVEGATTEVGSSGPVVIEGTVEKALERADEKGTGFE